jgi:hypothetical protein
VLRQICHPYSTEVIPFRPRFLVFRADFTLMTDVEKDVERKESQNWLTVRVSRMASPPMLFESGMFNSRRRFSCLGQLTSNRASKGAGKTSEGNTSPNRQTSLRICLVNLFSFVLYVQDCEVGARCPHEVIHVPVDPPQARANLHPRPGHRSSVVI